MSRPGNSRPFPALEGPGFSFSFTRRLDVWYPFGLLLSGFSPLNAPTSPPPIRIFLEDDDGSPFINDYFPRRVRSAPPCGSRNNCFFRPLVVWGAECPPVLFGPPSLSPLLC